METGNVRRVGHRYYDGIGREKFTGWIYTHPKEDRDGW